MVDDIERDSNNDNFEHCAVYKYKMGNSELLCILRGGGNGGMRFMSIRNKIVQDVVRSSISIILWHNPFLSYGYVCVCGWVLHKVELFTTPKTLICVPFRSK